MLEQRDFEVLRDLIYERTGMMFEDRKRPTIQARLVRRLKAVGCETAREYYRYLRYQDTQETEFQKFIEALTTNETYFFRESPLLRCFADEALPMITDKKRKNHDYTISVWSAGCSTGDEPYTLAIILRECLDDWQDWNFRLQASDIDTQVLATARRASYCSRAVQDVPDVYMSKYFKLHMGEFQVTEDIKRMVTFKQINLMDRPTMRSQVGFDFIFCRNVLIYFDDASRKQVLSSFYNSLTPGGFIFLGHSESVGRISAAFELMRLNNGIVYRRPEENAVRSKTMTGGGVCQTV